jgi:TonB family protein
MKSIVTAGVLALGIHGLIFCFQFNWPGRPSFAHPVPLVLNMTLTSITGNTSREPSLEKEEPLLKQQTMGQKRKKPLSRNRTKTQKKKARIIKQQTMFEQSKKQSKLAHHTILNNASVPKPVQTPLQPKANDTSKLTAEHDEDGATADFGFKSNASKTASKFVEHDGASLSPLETIHEAKPAYRSNPSPQYPRIARIRGYQGNVLLDVLVNADGKVDDVKIFKSSGYPVLDRTAKSTVKLWLFEPGRIGKRKVDMWVRVPIRFELTE